MSLATGSSLSDRLPRFARAGLGRLDVPLLVAVAGIVGLGLFFDQESRATEERRQEAEVSVALGFIQTDLERLMAGDLHLLHGLVAALEVEPEMSPARFDQIARRLFERAEHLRVLAAAPDLVVSMVYPENEAVLGLDYRATPDQWASVREALAEPGMVLSGPTQLVQGGEGLVARAAVVIPGEAEPWGIVSAVLDTASLFRAVGLHDAALPIVVAIRGTGANAGESAVFGDQAIFDAGPILADLSLPECDWQLAAIPAGGWSQAPAHRALTWLLVLGLGGLVIAPLHLARRLSAERTKTIVALEDRERELDRLSRRLDLALTASTVGVWDYNIDRDELVWDTRMNELYGMPEDKREHSYADWRDRLHPADLPVAEATFRAAVDGRARYETQFRVVLPGGATRHIRAIGAVYREADGTHKIVGVNWDVSADVDREEELVTRRREAEAASIAKSRFLAQMSHEVRTPMAGVLGMLDLLLDSRLDVTQRNRAETARAAAASLMTVVDDILDLSKLEADRFELDAANVEIDILLDEVVALFQPMAEQKGLAIGIEVVPHVPRWLVLDPVRLRQIVVNLLSNAVKFTDSGRIDLRVGYTRRTARLTIAVADTGIGIDPSEATRLFQPFTQLESGLERRVGGTGLGLAISRRLANLMGGEIGLESEAGRGATFTLSIRAPRGQAPERAESGETPPPARPLSILLVEDNPTNRLVVSAMLERAGHTVTSADDGAEALAALDSGRFDAILMDVEMPRMDGPTATRLIRARPGPEARLPIIALTANAMAGDRERYLALGMTDYLSKPLDPKALRAAIARAAAQTETGPDRRAS